MFWKKNGRFIKRNGKFIKCDDCPCFCAICRDIEKAYQKGIDYQDHHLTAYRESDYEDFTETYERVGEIYFNGQKGVDWGVFAFTPVYYPAENPQPQIIDARGMSRKYGRKGCYYQYETGCQWYGNYIYPNCKTTASFNGYKNFKKFDITICVDTGAHIHFDGSSFSYSTDYIEETCGDISGKIIIDGVQYGSNGSGSFDFPGYATCEPASIFINDHYDHAGNNYHYGGSHTYNLSFYMPIHIYEGNINTYEQEDDIQ